MSGKTCLQCGVVLFNQNNDYCDKCLAEPKKQPASSTHSDSNTRDTSSDINNNAESVLGSFNGIMLGIGVIASIVLLSISFEEGWPFFIGALVVLLVSVISWATMKVVLNISNNLHQINSKLK